MLGYVSSDFEDATAHLAEAYKLDSTFPTPLLFESISLSNRAAIRRPTRSRTSSRVCAPGSTPSTRTGWTTAWRSWPATAPERLRRCAGWPITRRERRTYDLGVEALENGHVDEAIRALTSLPSDRGPMRGWAAYWGALWGPLPPEG